MLIVLLGLFLARGFHLISHWQFDMALLIWAVGVTALIVFEQYWNMRKNVDAGLQENKCK